MEGFEPQVLRSAARLLAARRVPDLLMEYSPGVAERHRRWGCSCGPPAARQPPHLLTGKLPAPRSSRRRRCLARHHAGCWCAARCRWHDALQFPATLLALKSLNYTVLHINETKLLGEPLDWGSELEEMREVTEANLRLDMADTLALEAQVLGCPMPKPLAQQFSGWQICNQKPEQVGGGLYVHGIGPGLEQQAEPHGACSQPGWQAQPDGAAV